jgi:hypothetical protein
MASLAASSTLGEGCCPTAVFTGEAGGGVGDPGPGGGSVGPKWSPPLSGRAAFLAALRTLAGGCCLTAVFIGETGRGSGFSEKSVAFDPSGRKCEGPAAVLSEAWSCGEGVGGNFDLRSLLHFCFGFPFLTIPGHGLLSQFRSSTVPVSY